MKMFESSLFPPGWHWICRSGQSNQPHSRVWGQWHWVLLQLNMSNLFILLLACWLQRKPISHSQRLDCCGTMTTLLQALLLLAKLSETIHTMWLTFRFGQFITACWSSLYNIYSWWLSHGSYTIHYSCWSIRANGRYCCELFWWYKIWGSSWRLDSADNGQWDHHKPSAGQVWQWASCTFSDHWSWRQYVNFSIISGMFVIKLWLVVLLIPI